MWALVELNDDASIDAVYVSNEKEPLLEYLKEVVLRDYLDSFETDIEEEVFRSAIKDADTFEEIADLAEGFEWGDRDIPLYHLVKVSKL